MTDDFLDGLKSEYPDRMIPISAQTVNIDGMELPAQMSPVENNPPGKLSYYNYLDEHIPIKDTRTTHPVTGQHINPNRDLYTGSYNMPLIQDIIAKSKKVGYDPYKALAVGLFETQLGKSDENIGHVMNPEGSMKGVTGEGYDDLTAMVETLKHYDDLAKKTKYNTDEYRIQAYNSPAILSDSNVFLTPKTEKKYHKDTGRSTQYFYGVDVSKAPLNLRENPAYGKTVMSLAKMLQSNPSIQKLVGSTQNNQGLVSGDAMQSQQQTKPNTNLWQTDRTAWVDSIHNDPTNRNKDFVKRYFDQSVGSIPDPYDPESGKRSTHLMSYDPGSMRAYPEVVNVNGKLQFMKGNAAWDYADKTGEYIQFKTPQQAEWYSNGTVDENGIPHGYKQGTGVLTNIKNNTINIDGMDLPAE